MTPGVNMLTAAEVHRIYKLTPHYIKMHAEDLGAMGKPRLFEQSRVELHLIEKVWGSVEKKLAAEERTRELRTLIDGRVRTIQSAASAKVATGIQGRGGRRKGEEGSGKFEERATA